VDGLQLSTGVTYGKRNIEIHPAEAIRIVVTAKESGKSLALRLQPAVVERIKSRAQTLEELAEEVMAEEDIGKLWEPEQSLREST
jgi:formylmethanofuran dehydrogenase subunit E